LRYFQTFFRQKGKVANIELVRNRHGRSTGTCYVTYTHAEDAQDVMHKYQGHIAMGRPITLTVVSPKTPETLSKQNKLRPAAGNIMSPAEVNDNPTHTSPSNEESKVESHLHTQEQNNIITPEPLMPRDGNITTMQQQDADMSDYLGAFAPQEETTLPALDMDDDYDLIF
jgi:RNA recognition motif-containing protein